MGDRPQMRLLGSQGGNDMEVLLHVGNHVEPARPQNVLALSCELRREDAPFEMALLPPGIGEVDMDGLHRCRRQRIPEEEPGIGLHQPSITQVPFGQARCREELVLACDLDPQKICRAGKPGPRQAETNPCRSRLLSPRDCRCRRQRASRARQVPRAAPGDRVPSAASGRRRRAAHAPLSPLAQRHTQHVSVENHGLADKALHIEECLPPVKTQYLADQHQPITGRTGLRKRTFSRPPKPTKSPCSMPAAIKMGYLVECSNMNVFKLWQNFLIYIRII